MLRSFQSCMLFVQYRAFNIRKRPVFCPTLCCSSIEILLRCAERIDCSDTSPSWAKTVSALSTVFRFVLCCLYMRGYNQRVECICQNQAHVQYFWSPRIHLTKQMWPLKKVYTRVYVYAILKNGITNITFISHSNIWRNVSSCLLRAR